MSTLKLERTDEPHIENLLEKYSDNENLLILALGSSYWTPPKVAIDKTISDIKNSITTHKYGGIFGLSSLRQAIHDKLYKLGLANMSEMEVIITPGANQAFSQLCLTLMEPTHSAIVLAPYYFSHLMALQIIGVKTHICPFDKKSFLPDWPIFEEMMITYKPHMVVLTTPNNPSGKVWTSVEIQRLVDICKSVDAWLVVDQTYMEFTYDEASHVIPDSIRFKYDKICHVFSFSKCYGMPGWRVGYIVCPQILVSGMRKVQDSYPTHVAIASQTLARYCMENDNLYANSHSGETWICQQVATLTPLREALWKIVRKLGTVRTSGAIYFLLPLPPQVTEEEAVHILAMEYGVLLMYGSSFGAPNHLRMSYGSIAPEKVLSACGMLERGIDKLLAISEERQKQYLLNGA